MYNPDKIMISLYDENFYFIRYDFVRSVFHNSPNSNYKRFLAIFQDNDLSIYSDSILEHYSVKRFKRNA